MKNQAPLGKSKDPHYPVRHVGSDNSGYTR